MSHRPVTVVAGAGPGNGAALARRFAASGYAMALLARGSGTILFTGATASLRGGKATAAFAPAKAAQRSLAESMARSLWPAGIHVGVVIVDGVVDLSGTRAAMPDKPDGFFDGPGAPSPAAGMGGNRKPLSRAWDRAPR